MAEPINQLTLADAVIRDATLPQGRHHRRWRGRQGRGPE
jgi:hypothetical protein